MTGLDQLEQLDQRDQSQTVWTMDYKLAMAMGGIVADWSEAGVER